MSRFRSIPTRKGLAVASIVGGTMFLTIVGVYLFLDLRSGGDAEKFNVSVSEEALPEVLGRQAPDQGSPLTDSEFTALAGLYPAIRVNPKYWADPQFAGSDPYGGPGIPEGFEPFSSDQLPAGIDPTLIATRMRIPAIDLDSSVDPLDLVDLGDQSAYRTPDNTVGFIPETGSPAELQSGWYFGHLEGFVSGEGNVFRKLPQIAELLSEDPVDIFLATEDAEYMYRVTATVQIPQEDLHLIYNDRNDVHLVTCWPPRIYDQRIVVTAELVAMRAFESLAGNS